MAAVFTPHWEKDSGPLSPTNWIVYVVSKIHGHYYPLSVWCHENPDKLKAGRENDPWRGRGFIDSCLRTVSIFSNPNNRRAIQNELNKAKTLYQNPEDVLLPTFQLPIRLKGQLTSTQDGHVVRNDQGSLQESRDKFEHCPFPFISTCLLLGASSYLPSHRYNFFENWQPMPLSLAYSDEQLPHGIVVIDITDQTQVGYGIIAFAAYEMVGIEDDPDLDSDGWGLEFGPQKMQLEDERHRVVLSASDYISKFEYEQAENMERFYVTCPELKQLEKVPVIDACALNVIWPVTPRTLPSVLPQYSPCRTEFDESIVDLVDAALTREEVDVSHFDSFRNLDHFQDTLRSVLPQMLRHFSASGAVDQLVRLAFDGCEHMDIVDFKGLSAGTVSEALETKELTIHLADALAQCSNIEKIYVMYEPEVMRNYQPIRRRQSIEFLARLLDKSEDLLGTTIFLSDIYQAAICKTLWFSRDYQPPYNHFPIRNIFYRTQLNAYDPATYCFGHFRMDYMLLGPESFVARFLNWLRHPDFYMAGMACGPETLAELSQLDIRPLPIGGRAQPQRFLEAADTILARGWTLLVSKRTFTNYLVVEDNMYGSRENMPEYCQCMEYAFVRSGRDGQDGKPQVVGVRGFLEIMALEVDLDLVDKELMKTGSCIETWEEQAPFLPSMEALRLLDTDDEEDDLFREFLRSTVVPDTREHPEMDY